MSSLVYLFKGGSGSVVEPNSVKERIAKLEEKAENQGEWMENLSKKVDRMLWLQITLLGALAFDIAKFYLIK